jgi:selenide,water dikinase
MKADATPILKDIVLVGGGHSHVGVLRHFAMQPLPGVRLTLVCTDTDTPYSGMLPGYVAGHYGFDDVHIDLRRLCAFAGARYLRAEVTGLDRAARKVLLRGRPPVAYDLASINIGSTPQPGGVPGADEHAVGVKPIRRFNERWLALLERVRQHEGRTVIAVVGAGAAGVELTLAMQHRLRKELQALGRDPDALDFHLFSAGPDILPTHNARVRRRFERVLAERGVNLHRDAEVVAVAAGQLTTKNGDTLPADEIVWVTQAGGAAWLRATGLELDAAGFIHVTDTLQSTADPLVFAAGDCAALPTSSTLPPLEKAGVFAVRMGMPLAKNLRHALLGQPLEPYRPQRRWLALISTGDKNAVASRGAFYAAGTWVWRWKDWIDRRFMQRFNALERPEAMDGAKDDADETEADDIQLDADESAQAISAIAMRCGGCGAKVGATVLSRALAELKPIDRPEVLIGLNAPDDAAVIAVPPGKAVVQTVDFFRAFIDDPWTFGRIAANHALGDIFAMGGEAVSATAIATVPPGLERQTEETLRQMMAGAVAVLNAAGCALVGGHTGEGRELALGFAINGTLDLVDGKPAGAMTKGGLRPGDALILTKPIGTGTLFAALPLLKARGRWIDAALESMVRSNRDAARILAAHGATACTDLTGFGLLGHLVEITKASGVDAEIDLKALPLLDGALETAAAGVLSSLQPANVRLRRAIRNPEEVIGDPRYPLLFDPQTAGGLLAGVAAERVEACLDALREAGDAGAACIGQVQVAGDALEPIRVIR